MNQLLSSPSGPSRESLRKGETALARFVLAQLQDVVPGTDFSQCCGSEPMLRVRPQFISGLLHSPVQYECRKCGRTGGASMSVETARTYWLQTMRLAQHAAEASMNEG